MWSNFRQMPELLKLLTFMGVFFSVMGVLMVILPVEESVFEENISFNESWTKSFGIYTLLTVLPFLAASYLSLIRNRFAREIYFLSFILAGIWEAVFIETDRIWIAVFSSYLLPAGLLGVYLYSSKSVENYFKLHDNNSALPATENDG